MKRGNRSVLVISVAVLIGIILGNLAGNALSDVVPFFSKTISLGLDDFSLKLYVLDFHIGLLFNVNVLGLVGGLIGLLTATKY
ncbi:MAG: DUF4321 domain-containing protein [Peptostreptococcaceae bacterium]|nr:DUF4321 domain-containing protein [Peptostreptococcaceae bacterium]